MRAPLALSGLALIALGCSTGSLAERAAPTFTVASLEVPDAVEAAAGWTDIQDAATPGRPPEVPHGPFADNWNHYVSLLGGQRWLDEDIWGDLDEPVVLGLELNGEASGSGNGYEVGGLYTNDDADFGPVGPVESELTTGELYAGYRYTFNSDEQGLHPFVSAGADMMYGELKLSGGGSSSTEDDTVFGIYARAGLLWDVSERLRLGLDYRYLYSDDYQFDFPGGKVDAKSDYDQVVLSLGWRF